MLYRVAHGEGRGRLAAGLPSLVCNPYAGGGGGGGSAGGRAGSSGGRRCTSLSLLLTVLVALVAVVAARVHGSTSSLMSTRPMRLASIDADSGDVQLHDEALGALAAARGPVCALAIAGPRREGKSALGNEFVRRLRVDEESNPP